jgi:mutator protein MutT
VRANDQRVVVVALIERGGRLLVSQRGTGAFAGLWEFPGGKREAGETDEQALARELSEELAIKVEIGLLAHTARAGPLELRFFRCGWMGGQRPRALEAVQFRWVPRADLTAYRFLPADSGLIAALTSGEI